MKKVDRSASTLPAPSQEVLEKHTEAILEMLEMPPGGTAKYLREKYGSQPTESSDTECPGCQLFGICMYHSIPEEERPKRRKRKA